MTLDRRFKDPKQTAIALDLLADIVATVNTMEMYLKIGGPHKDQRIGEGLELISKKCKECRSVLMGREQKGITDATT
jgi:hypothetical protein